MSDSSRVFLGDLVRALSAVDDGGSGNRAAIAEMLGFDLRVVAAVPAVDRIPSITRPDMPTTIATRTAREPPPIRSDDNDDAGSVGLIPFDLQQRAGPTEPELLETESNPPTAWMGSPLPFDSLFDPLWERGILVEAGGAPAAEGDLALAEAVDAIARKAPLRSLPFALVQSMSRGCQILLDRGVGMRPFARDGQQLVRSLRRVVGVEHTLVMTFVDCPTRGVMNERYEDEVYAPPSNGATVLAISDLCQGGPRGGLREAEPEHWLVFATAIRRAGSSLVVVNPYPPAEWPRSVAERVPIIFWDRLTRAADARRARRGRSK